MKTTLLIMTLILSLNVFAEGETKSDCTQTQAQSDRVQDEAASDNQVKEEVKSEAVST
jgi:hypothetical protein